MYKVKEGYKMTELGEIPEDWECKKLDEIASITRLAGAEYSDVWKTDEHGEIIALKGNNIGENKLNLNDTERITEEMSNRLIRSKLFENDIVFPCVGTIGKAALINEDNKYHINQNIAKITLDEGVYPLYLTYFLMSKFTKNQILKYNTSSSQPNVLVGNLRRFDINIPLLKEQKKISIILSSVDEQIENTNNLIEKTKELKKGLMQRFLTKGIGHDRFKDTEIGRIPEEWEVKKLSDVTDIISGGTPNTQQSEYWDSGNVLWATPTDITSSGKYIRATINCITDIGLKNSSANLLPVGSILMTSRATIGARCINKVPMCTNQGFKSFICKADLYNEFMFYLVEFIKKDLIALAAGSTFLEISKSAVESYKILVPPVGEQKHIASILSSIDEQIEQYESKKEKFQDLKQGLMQKLLTGKIRVKI